MDGKKFDNYVKNFKDITSQISELNEQIKALDSASTEGDNTKEAIQVSSSTNLSPSSKYSTVSNTNANLASSVNSLGGSLNTEKPLYTNNVYSPQTGTAYVTPKVDKLTSINGELWSDADFEKASDSLTETNNILVKAREDHLSNMLAEMALIGQQALNAGDRDSAVKIATNMHAIHYLEKIKLVEKDKLAASFMSARAENNKLSALEEYVDYKDYLNNIGSRLKGLAVGAGTAYLGNKYFRKGPNSNRLLATALIGGGGTSALASVLPKLGPQFSASLPGRAYNAAVTNPITAGSAVALGTSAVTTAGNAINHFRQRPQSDFIPNKYTIGALSTTSLMTALGLINAESKRPNSWVNDLTGSTNTAVTEGARTININPLAGGAVGALAAAGAGAVLNDVGATDLSNKDLLGLAVMGGGAGALGTNAVNHLGVDYSRVRVPVRRDIFS